KTFRDLKPHLKAHRTLRQGTDESFQCMLGPVSHLVVVIEAVQPAEFISGDHASVRLNHRAVEVFTDRQQLAKRGLLNAALERGYGLRASHFRNSFISWRSASRPQ